MKTSILKRALQVPGYGFEKEGQLYRPSTPEIWSEFFSRLNIFSDLKNWIGVFELFVFFVLLAAFLSWVTFFHEPKWIAIGLAYGFFLNLHGTAYLHRYGSHNAFEVKSPFALFILRNLSIKVYSEEIFVISHSVHHHQPETAGDPYNVHGGWLYCFLSDFNHQPINRNLDEGDYLQVARLIAHQGVKLNRYDQYLRFGSIAHPGRMIMHFFLNWCFWFAVFFSLGGWGLVTATFGICFIWSVSLRSFNYKSHGKGQNRQREGVEFNRKDLSVNRPLAGYSAGEWHNHHHLYPTSARAGFLPHQLDFSFYFIVLLYRIGIISQYNDHRERFLKEHYLPYQAGKKANS